MNLPPCPASGEGVSDWIHLVGLKSETPAEAEAIAIAAVSGYGTRYPLHKIRREIRRAFDYKGTNADFTWSGKAPERSFISELKDIRPDTKTILKIVKDGPELGELYDHSPYRDVDAGEMLDVLFPGNPWLCCGFDTFKGDCLRLDGWKTELARLQFIVPTPQSGPRGINTDGKESWHCLSNCLDRRFIIVEFDQGSKDGQAAILWHLRDCGLAMVVDSGSKSLHGWFYCQGVREEKVKRFFKYARSLCADPVHWTPSQFTRMPNGSRNGVEQVTYYFDPEAVA